MQSLEIRNLIEGNHQSFLTDLDKYTKSEYEFQVNDKWNAGQHLSHLVASIKPLGMLRLLPKFILGYKFGKANRPSRSYSELVEKYNTALKDPRLSKLIANNPFGTKNEVYENKTLRINELNATLNRYLKSFNRFSEKDLDSYVLPHPAMGKITLREMAYFTAYHVKHHQLIMEKQVELMK